MFVISTFFSSEIISARAVFETPRPPPPPKKKTPLFPLEYLTYIELQFLFFAPDILLLLGHHGMPRLPKYFYFLFVVDGFTFTDKLQIYT